MYCVIIIIITRQLPVEMQRSKRHWIRLCCKQQQSKRRLLQHVAWCWRIYDIVESESDPLTFSKKNPSRANGRSTYIHPPSLAKIRQRTSEEIGNKHTNKRCLNYSMIRKAVYLNITYWKSLTKRMLLVVLYIHTSVLQNTHSVGGNFLWNGFKQMWIWAILPTEFLYMHSFVTILRGLFWKLY